MVAGWKNPYSPLQKWEIIPFKDIVASTFTFASYNMGHDSTDEADTFYDAFKEVGFQAVDWRDNKRLYISAGRMKHMSRYADFVYFNGHGGTRANLFVEKPSDDYYLQEWLMPAKSIDLGGYAYAPKTEIGADWIDEEHTNSSWDLYTKWIIMGNCAQLNYKNEEHNDGAYWNGLRTAQIWARTMKSAGRHVHGFVGYYGVAAGTTTHKEDMERFLSDVCEGKSVVYSWRDALTRLPGQRRNWACMYYLPCVDDCIRLNPSRLVYAEPSVDDRIRYLSRLSTVAFDIDTRSTVSQPFVPIKVTEAVPDIALQRETVFSSFDSQMDENHILKLTRRDDSAVSSGADPTAMAEAALVEQALQELAEIGLCPPEGAYSAFVDIIGCYDFDEHCEPVSDEPEITEKIVYLCQTYNGRKLFTEDGNGIRLSYDKQGLKEMEYKWYDIEEDPDRKVTLSSRNASDIFADYLAEREENSYDTTGPEVYYEKDGVVHPARVFYQGADYTRPVYIDLETNEVLSNEE